MSVVAAAIDQGALTFDLAIPCEVFGLDRSDIADPWYEFMVVAAGRTPVRTQTGFMLDTPYGLDDLERADTIVVPGWSDPEDRPSARRFSTCVGSSPGEWLQRERIRLAQRLLESTDQPLDSVARRAGYSSPTTMRAQFARRLRTSPRRYRETFRGNGNGAVAEAER